MSYYIVVDIKIHDPEGYEEYKEKVAPLIAKCGGRYLVRAGELTTIGDDWKPERIVILEFPDKKTSMAFFTSEEYAPLQRFANVAQRPTDLESRGSPRYPPA